MTRAALLLRRLLVPRLGIAPPRPSARRGRRSARAALGWFAAAFLTLNAATFAAFEARPDLRDPEYGKRVISLQARIAEHPGRPVVLAVGSSRMSMGVCPAAWEEVRPGGPSDPLVFNLSLVGSGPITQLLCLRRAYADGLKPDAIVLEYWPPFLREDGAYFEPDRLDPTRLLPADRPMVRDYFRDPAAAEARMLAARANPVFENRHRLLARVFPSWLPWTRRVDTAWAGLDGWGWLPGMDDPYPPPAHHRAACVAHCEPIYKNQFAGYTVHPAADRAIREAIALARSNGAKVAFAYLPEATEFRGWYPPAVETAARDHLAGLRRELAVPLIDARDWMPDGYLVDGFHLSRVGAAEFSRRFGPAVAATLFPPGGQP